MEKDLTRAPGPEYVRELSEHIESYWSTQRTLDTELKDLVLGTQPVEVPDTEHPDRIIQFPPEKMTSGEAARTIDIIGSLYPQAAQLSVMWTGEGVRSQSRADETEIALNEAIDQLNPPGDKPRDREIAQMLTLGRLARLQVPTWMHYHNFPEKEAGETEEAWAERYRAWQTKAPLPVLWMDLPAESTFPPSLGRVDEEALCTIEMTWAELAGIFSQAELGDLYDPKDTKRRFEKATLGIYANTRWLCYTVMAGEKSGLVGRGYKDRIVRKVEHGLDKCAIRILAGKTGPWKEPGIYWRSVLYTSRAELKQLDKALSHWATAGFRRALPFLKFHLNKKDDGSGTSRLQQVLMGDAIELDPGDQTMGTGREDVAPLYEPQQSDDLQALVALQLDLIRRKTGAMEALEGRSPVSGTTAWQENMKIQVAQNYFAPLTQAIAEADLDAADMIIRCVKSYGEKITLKHQREGEPQAGAIVLVPEELQNWQPVLGGEFGPRIPTNKQAIFDLGLKAMVLIDQHNLPVAMDTVMGQMLDIEQPFQEWERAQTWKLIRNPQVEDWYVKKQLEDMDVMLAEDEGMSPEEFEKMAASGALPPQVVEMVRGRMQMQQAQGGAGLNGQAQGMVQAQNALSQPAGGPQPQEMA